MTRFLKLFSAAPVRSDYADAGDLLRVISAFLVAWFHIWQQSWLNPDRHSPFSFRIEPLVRNGYMFVDLLLLLSGFLLMLGWLSGRGRSKRNFYVARAARILPSYLLCIFILLAFALRQNLYGSLKQLWLDLLSHLSFTHNLFYDSYIGTKLGAALWTLAVEVQFYLLFPLLAKAFDRKPRLTYCSMLALGLGARIAVTALCPDTSLCLNRLSCMMDVYANGMLAACIYKKLADKPQRTWQAWLSTLLTLASAVLLYRIFCLQSSSADLAELRVGQMFWRLPLSLLGCVFLVCASRSIRGLRLLISCRLFRFLSTLSFNFYIWHQVWMLKLKEWRIPPYVGSTPQMDGQQPWQDHYTYLCFGGALILSAIVTYLIEKPCAKRIRRRLSSKEA